MRVWNNSSGGRSRKWTRMRVWGSSRSRKPSSGSCSRKRTYARARSSSGSYKLGSGSRSRKRTRMRVPGVVHQAAVAVAECGLICEFGILSGVIPRRSHRYKHAVCTHTQLYTDRNPPGLQPGNLPEPGNSAGVRLAARGDRPNGRAGNRSRGCGRARPPTR